MLASNSIRKAFESVKCLQVFRQFLFPFRKVINIINYLDISKNVYILMSSKSIIKEVYWNYSKFKVRNTFVISKFFLVLLKVERAMIKGTVEVFYWSFVPFLLCLSCSGFLGFIELWILVIQCWIVDTLAWSFSANFLAYFRGEVFIPSTIGSLGPQTLWVIYHK